MDLAGKLREGYFRSPGIATAVSVIIPKLSGKGAQPRHGTVAISTSQTASLHATPAK